MLCRGIGALPRPLRIPDVLDRLGSLTPQVVRTIRLLRFYVAPLEGDVHLFDRVEGVIGLFEGASSVGFPAGLVEPRVSRPA